jgi:hypothetical protein
VYATEVARLSASIAGARRGNSDGRTVCREGISGRVIDGLAHSRGRRFASRAWLLSVLFLFCDVRYIIPAEVLHFGARQSKTQALGNGTCRKELELGCQILRSEM